MLFFYDSQSPSNSKQYSPSGVVIATISREGALPGWGHMRSVHKASVNGEIITVSDNKVEIMNKLGNAEKVNLNKRGMMDSGALLGGPATASSSYIDMHEVTFCPETVEHAPVIDQQVMCETSPQFARSKPPLIVVQAG